MNLPGDPERSGQETSAKCQNWTRWSEVKCQRHSRVTMDQDPQISKSGLFLIWFCDRYLGFNCQDTERLGQQWIGINERDVVTVELRSCKGGSYFSASNMHLQRWDFDTGSLAQQGLIAEDIILVNLGLWVPHTILLAQWYVKLLLTHFLAVKIQFKLAYLTVYCMFSLCM